MGDLLGRLDYEDDAVVEKRLGFRLVEGNANIFKFDFGTKPRSESIEKSPMLAKGENEKMKYHGVTIQRTPSGNGWYTRIRLGGKQVYISNVKQEVVLKKLKAVIEQKKKGERIVGQYTLAQWYKDWFDLYKKDYVKKDTAKEYLNYFNRISDKLKNTALTQIGSDDIARELQSVTGARAKQKFYEFVGQLFKKAYEVGKINRSPTLAVVRPKYIRDRGVALTNSERKRFVKVCTEKQLYVFLVLLYQGFRPGEVLGITWDDIDIENRTISINKSFNDDGEFDSTKNTQSERTVPIFEPTFNIFKELEVKDGERVFKYRQDALRKLFEGVKLEVGLPHSLRVYDLRHSFISYAQSQEIPEHIIQHWVGHRIGSKVTSTTYTHVNEDDNLLFTNKLNLASTTHSTTHD